VHLRVARESGQAKWYFYWKSWSRGPVQRVEGVVYKCITRLWSERCCLRCTLTFPYKSKNINKTMSVFLHLESILSTFYKQLLCQYSFTKKLQTHTVTREKLSKNFCTKMARVKSVKCWWNWHLGSISSTLYEQLLFMQILKAPKKRHWSCQSFLHFRDLLMQKLLVEHWWNWPLCSHGIQACIGVYLCICVCVCVCVCKCFGVCACVGVYVCLLWAYVSYFE